MRPGLAPALVTSLVLHAVAVSGLVSTTPGLPHPDVLVIELASIGRPSAPETDTGGAATADTTRGAAPALGATAPRSAGEDDRIAALVAERDALAQQLAGETAERTRLGNEVAALAAENVELSQAVAAERARAEQLAASLREQQAAAERAMREMERAHEALLAALHEEIAERDVALRRTGEGLTVSVVDQVLFPSGQADLTPQGVAVIDKVAGALAAVDGRRIVIEGHTDNVPIGPELRVRFPTNWELSTARATEVVRRLVERGLSPLRLEPVGRADTMPIASNDTEAGRQRNRRIEIILSDPVDRAPS